MVGVYVSFFFFFDGMRNKQMKFVQALFDFSEDSPTEAEDKRLCKEAQAGNKSAVDVLIRKHQGAAYYVARKYAKSAEMIGVDFEEHPLPKILSFLRY